MSLYGSLHVREVIQVANGFHGSPAGGLLSVGLAPLIKV